MSASLPSALRERFRHYFDEGFSGRAAAAQLRISAVTGSRWACGIRQRGRAMPLKQGRPAGRGKPSPYQAFIEESLWRRTRKPVSSITRTPSGSARYRIGAWLESRPLWIENRGWL